MLSFANVEQLVYAFKARLL